MICVTCCSARVQFNDLVTTSSPVHSLNRYITSLSDGATHVSFTGFALRLPCASGVSTNVAAPPLASEPWQLAHCSDFALSYAGIEALAKSVAPRSTARLLKPPVSST